MRKGKRLIAVVLALTVALGSVCWKPPKAQAVVIEASAAFGAAAATAAINGTTATTLFTGMGTSAATGSVIGLMDTYAAATGVAASGTALASSIATGILVSGGVLLVGAAAAALIGGFIDWLREEKGLEAGGDVVSLAVGNAYLADGTLINIPLDASDANFTEYTYFEYNKQYTTSTGKTFSLTRDLSSWGGNEFVVDGVVTGKSTTSKKVIYYFVSPNRSDATSSSSLTLYGYYRDFSDAGVGFSTGLTVSDLFGDFTSIAMSMDPKVALQELPQELPEGQVLKIDTGLETLPADDPQAAADAIMQTAIDGALDPVVTVESDPDTGTETDPDGSTETTPDTDLSILDWLKQIWESICNIPSAIAEAIASIFVPSPDFYPTAISNLKDTFSDRMGLLTYPISVLFDFLDRVVNLSEQQPILTWGSIYLPGYATPLVAAGQYNLNDAIGTSAGKQLHDIYLVIVDAIMILAFVDLCRRKYQKIIHN